MKIRGVLALLVSGTLVLAGPVGSVDAHTFTDNTRLTLNVSDRQVRRGDDVAFFGRLIAQHATCRNHRAVKLYRNHRPVERTQTNSNGFYRFNRVLRRTATWQVRFGGFVEGTHPHSHTCRKSGSRRISVTVRRN